MSDGDARVRASAAEAVRAGMAAQRAEVDQILGAATAPPGEAPGRAPALSGQLLRRAAAGGGAGAPSAVKKPHASPRIALCVRQGVAELRKVVTPTRSELITYTTVVLVFVVVVMAFVTVLDLGIGQAVRWVFG